jgi:hypothetical protein
MEHFDFAQGQNGKLWQWFPVAEFDHRFVGWQTAALLRHDPI